MTDGSETPSPTAEAEDRRTKVLAEYRKTLLQHKEVDAKVRSSERAPIFLHCTIRFSLVDTK